MPVKAAALLDAHLWACHFEDLTRGFMNGTTKTGLFAYTLAAFLGLLIAHLVSPGRAAPQALQEVRIGSSNISATNFSTFYARDRKFFQKEGLDAKIIIVRSEVALTALIAGNLDFTTLSTTAMEGTMRGMPLRVVAITNQYPLIGLVVNDKIKKVADLKGRKLAVSSFGGSVYSAAVFLLKNYGLKPQEDVAVLASGTNTARMAALKQGAVDAALISSPDDLRAAKEGLTLLLDVGTIYKLPFGGISTTVAKIKENPMEVKRVLNAVVQATKAIAEPQNRDDVINYIVSFFKLDKNIASEFYHRLIPSLSPSGIVGRDQIKLVIDSAVERGLADKPLDPDAVSDFSIAKQLRF
ncbi:MAG TPA: ABC transporter substrate-binding protein [Candidatus Binatia bacterium]|jgi:NitT/TauT family transport system substrate-binding protein